MDEDVDLDAISFTFDDLGAADAASLAALKAARADASVPAEEDLGGVSTPVPAPIPPGSLGQLDMYFTTVTVGSLVAYLAWQLQSRKTDIIDVEITTRDKKGKSTTKKYRRYKVSSEPKAAAAELIELARKLFGPRG